MIGDKINKVEKKTFNLVIKEIVDFDDEDMVDLITLDLQDVTDVDADEWQELYDNGELVGKTILENVSKEKSNEIIEMLKEDGVIVVAE